MSITLPDTALPSLPALVEGTVAHTRRTPLTHRFRYRVYQWLVDVDDLPRLPRLLRPFSTFRAADHIGDPESSIRDNIVRYCHAHGLDVADHKILMLANARVLGHVFDPLSVFWVIAPDGGLTCIVAEVHNTYGERHAYLLDPDETGRADTDKAFYVSPFFSVDGRYDLRFELGSSSVSASVVLRQGGDAVFGATLRGVPRPASPRRVAAAILKYPLMTQRTSLLIRVHGVWLWLRRLPVVPRPPHQPPEGTL
ncbi:hypothetical protein HMPREF0063_11155 [Aeromicrobium marinum DSM 15272]|uniref:DUF1365 domain-containing protein n=1 Tax=Aeromicrobium marinum DSM 15272 TaxID=585531 RepID=E2SAU7_9ACTN|nr:DUF1365 domain-containing protein [Aeromicrobium marinum]EFQ83493.1 hypothetical protein HMPREF0063_11155 [Aeromicrobium marinum DSM 15272]